MSFIAVSGDMAQQADVARPRASLKSRIISALVLAPFVLGAVYAGTYPYFLLIGLATLIMAWEWHRLCANGQFGITGIVFAVFVLAAVALASTGFPMEAFAPVVLGAAILRFWTARNLGHAANWMAGGVVAVGLTGIALIWIRNDADGLLITLWFLVAVWATDIAAFFAGRAIGGPKLAPSISPGKTWAGLIGGVLAAVFWSIGWALWTDAGQPGTLAALGFAAAIFAQMGDLGVSMVKRRFGAKDASQLIPGHGGLLDRVDGLIGAAPIAVVLVSVT
jgi:phosphatidate cytidylyltransferase